MICARSTLASSHARLSPADKNWSSLAAQSDVRLRTGFFRRPERRWGVAVILYMRIPELTLDRYDGMMVSLDLDANPPPGLILHAATEAVGSVNVCEAWQTPQAAESFVDNRLRDALVRQGVSDPLSYRLEPLHNLFAPDIDMIERIGLTSLPARLLRSALVS